LSQFRDDPRVDHLNIRRNVFCDESFSLNIYVAERTGVRYGSRFFEGAPFHKRRTQHSCHPEPPRRRERDFTMLRNVASARGRQQSLRLILIATRTSSNRRKVPFVPFQLIEKT